MKKTIYSIMALAIAAFTFTGCESIPMPYEEPTVNEGTGGGEDDGYVAPTAENTPETPLTVTEAVNMIKADANISATYYVKGIIAKIEKFDESHNSITYDISDDGTQTNMLQIYSGKGYHNANFTSIDELKVGQTVIVVGPFKNYNGKAEMNYDNHIYSIEGEGTGGDGGPTGEAKGTGTEADPYNVAGITNYTSGLTASNDGKENISDKEVYFKGIVESFKSGEEPGNSFGNATFYIQEQGGSDKFYCYRVMAGPNNKKFTSADELKVGDEVVICGNVVNYKGTTPETASGKAYVYSINGKKTEAGEGGDGGGTTGGGTGSTGTEMTAALINSGKTGTVSLTSNSYGSQSVSDENTWYTWKFNEITYKGARICNASAANGSGIQVQGYDDDTTKQGFIFNADAYAKDIKNVVLVARVVNTSTFDPSFSFYAGTTAHPTSGAVNATPAKTADGSFNVYTYTFDLSTGSFKYFTIANDKKGALYIDKIVVTLKD